MGAHIIASSHRKADLKICTVIYVNVNPDTPFIKIDI